MLGFSQLCFANGGIGEKGEIGKDIEKDKWGGKVNKGGKGS